MKTMLKAVMGLLFLGASICAGEESKSPNVLIVTGDHGHNWQATTPFLRDVLTKAGHNVNVTEKPRLDLTPGRLAEYDVILFNYRNTPRGAAANPESVWTEDNKQAFINAVKEGVGLVVYHHASSAFTGDAEFDREFEKLTAGGWRKQGYHGKMHEFTVVVRKDHPITHGIKSFDHGRDELYQNSLITPGTDVLATAYSEPSVDPKNTGKHEPMVWVNRYGKGRVCQNALGHDVEAMQSIGFKTLIVRCVEWAATGKATYPVPPELQSAN